ncbi:MAG: hypothetical protein HFG99_06440 [Dorea sp.]|jgi:predicted FMN-binding regulatory protein PaiB|nr:hypothetical protein [Dorea sp.]MCI9248777.1 hypothetical protein [Dorea sp.]
MNSIIEKLAAIEKTAEDIVDNAENQKFEAERQIQAERDEFDRKLEEEVNGRLEAIRSEGRAKMDQALNEERLKHRSVIDSLENEFAEHHTEYAKEILRQILEV